MASIKKRGNSYCVIYNCLDENGRRRQKWESYATKAEAQKRKKEIEYKNALGPLVVPTCTTLKELLDEYVSLYGKDKWALSTFDRNCNLLNNYVIPIIGKAKLTEINTRYLENYYQKLLKTRAVPNKAPVKRDSEFVGSSTIRDIHKLLRSCFEQAVKWEMMERNPAIYATVPKYKPKRRDIWTADILLRATDLCDDPNLSLAMNLAFAASLRIGELTALTWDCVEISPEAIENGSASVYINKELQRVSKEAIQQLEGKDIILTFPSESPLCTTVRVLKTPKTESSVRLVYIPRSVAEMLVRHKEQQDQMKELLGDSYNDYNLVLTTPFGMPLGGAAIRHKFNQLIKENDLPKVVFHSLRHTSVTYKLKLNGGDIKAVQGDSGHAQVNMVTDVYSHIIDEDRKKNAALFEDAFYGRQNLDPQLNDRPGPDTNTLTVPEGVDAEALAKVLANPEMLALISSMAKAMQTQ